MKGLEIVDFRFEEQTGFTDMVFNLQSKILNLQSVGSQELHS